MIYNETGYNNHETFGSLILPFWFKNESNPDMVLITWDGAGCHQDMKKILKIASEKCYNIPGRVLLGVPDTTFCT